MKVLFIGGTGTISTDISRKLLERGDELYVLNRGNRNDELQSNVKTLVCDVNDEERVAELIKDMSFDVVADFIAFVPSQVERDFRLFNGKTKQYIFISSASAYGKPVRDYLIRESTTLANPYWEYSRNKISCEEALLKHFREDNFPVTIIRPSHTYNKNAVPLGVHGDMGSWQVIKRMIEGKPVIIHGDGTSLWTMTHSRDFANAFIGLMGNIHAIGDCIHITSDESLTWNQIYECIADALGVQFNAVHVSSEFLDKTSKYDFCGSLIGDKANSVVFDNSKLKRLVPNFTATVSFREGVAEAVDYVMKNKELQTEDKEFDLWCDKIISVLENAENFFKETKND